MRREEQIARTFVELADTLVDDFDVIDFLHQLTRRCCEIFSVADAAVLLAYPGDRLHSPAPCNPGPVLAEVLHTALSEGPAMNAYRTGNTAVSISLADPGPDPDTGADRDGFTARAHRAGYTHACAVPLRLRGQTLGSLLLLTTTAHPLPAHDLTMARAFADAATIGLLHARTLQHTETVNAHLHTALHSRITIEQAKGLLAARRRIPLDAAFNVMRRHARHHRLLLTHVAHHVITTGDLPPATPSGPRSSAEPRPRTPTEDTPTD
ncbi:GAF and ANTAR domain-containing protein [Streptomyces sp. CRN 30]|uniref:GAF and ANTAR domain-containing protein n=1 Tax=Streptomyces sp. CRN 30 TaxID=3075613 RepID=UPI002A7EEB95|nr:GAF and ANTAR domain-containing protein [Streptomyces sp. CRN 30]